MKHLSPGDKVLTSNGDYKTMWTMNHYHAMKETRFIQITTDLEEEQPLELTPDHMLFVNRKDDPVPASIVKVGDKVLLVQKGLTDVVGIKTVVQNGFYNPLTMGYIFSNKGEINFLFKLF